MNQSSRIQRAFTLIELLVVIAIIAILAAILFPVFARAKVAAKKTVAISNQKQLSLSLILYMGDYDDTYPRQDSCVPYSALNTDFKTATWNPAGNPSAGCNNPYYNRVNHFSWQKYVIPYTKNLDILWHPLREKNPAQWKTQGQIFGGFALNLSITGASDSDFGLNPLKFYGNRLSFTGGTQSGVPDPSRAMVLLEDTLGVGPISQTITDDRLDRSGPLTAYPVAVREQWEYRLMKTSESWSTLDDVRRQCQRGLPISNESDPKKVAADGIVIGFVDGSAKFYPAGKLLAETPRLNEIFPGGISTSYGHCNMASGNLGFRSDPNLRLNYPLWGLVGN